MAAIPKRHRSSPPTWWQRACRRLWHIMAIFWGVIIAGIVITTIANILTTSTTTPLSQLYVIHWIIVYRIILLFVAGGLFLLTAISWIGSREHKTSSSPSPDQPSQVGVNTQDAVVLITSANAKDTSFGTGFMIHRDAQTTYVLTCAHVVNDIGESNLLVGHIPATLAATGTVEGIDLAVLRIAGLFDRPLLPLSPTSAKDQSFIIPGFQLSGTDRYLFRALHGTLSASVGLETREGDVRVKAWDLEITDEFSLQHGYSGSPVIVKESDRVIGVVNTRQGIGKKGLAIAVEMLDHIWKIPPVLPAPSTPIPNLAAPKEHAEQFNFIATRDGPSGKIPLGGSIDKTDDEWNVHTTQPLYMLCEQSEPIRAVAINSDRKILASGSAGGFIKLWDLNIGEGRQTLRQTLKGVESEVLCIAISPDKRIIASGHAYFLGSGVIELWDLETGQSRGILAEHTDDVIAIAFRTDGRTLISGSTDKTIRQWDIDNLESVGPPLQYLDYIEALAISADGEFAGVIDKKTIHLWDLATQQDDPILNIDTAKASMLAIKTDGNMLASGNNDGTISLLHRESKTEVATSKKLDIWKPIKNLIGQASSILCIAFSPDGQTIISGKGDGTIEIWDIGNFSSSLNA